MFSELNSMLLMLEQFSIRGLLVSSINFFDKKSKITHHVLFLLELGPIGHYEYTYVLHSNR